MEDQRPTEGQPTDQITYVGGLGEAPRGRMWPFVVLGLAPVILVILGVVLWNPIRSLGRNAGATIAPYSVLLTTASWSANQKIAGVPVTFTVGLENADQRDINGLTLQFTKLDRNWEIIGASSPESSAQINSSSIFFPDVVKPGGSTTLAVEFVPDKAMDTEIDFTVTPGNSSTPANLQLRDGSVATTFGLTVKVRDPVESDADARLTAIYDTHIRKGQFAGWQIHVANTGPIAIDGIRLKFSEVPAGFDFGVESDATILPDGQTVQFNTSLPPGGQTILLMGVTPSVSGHYQIPILVYLGKSTEPLSAADGGPPLSIDLTVN